MRHGSLFSGIGGFDLAAEWMGWENIFQVEWDEYCQRVLTKNFPNTEKYGDIKEFDGTKYRGTIDILSGGFPCQPFSHAGKRKGESDDRYLWPEYLRIIREIQPTYVVGENVAGLLSMDDGKTLDGIFTDLEGEGYEVESFVIPACGVGAWHRRDRIWIVAYTIDSKYTQQIRRGVRKENKEEERIRQTDYASRESLRAGPDGGASERHKDVSDTEGKRLCGEKKDGELGGGFRPTECGKRDGKRIENMWGIEPGVGRVANGIPKRVDRLKGLGNAIVPQVVYEIFKAIELNQIK